MARGRADGAVCPDPRMVLALLARWPIRLLRGCAVPTALASAAAERADAGGELGGQHAHVVAERDEVEAFATMLFA